MTTNDISAPMAAVDRYAVNHDERPLAKQAIRLHTAQAVVAALEQRVLMRGGSTVRSRMLQLAAARADVARIQAEVKEDA